MSTTFTHNGASVSDLPSGVETHCLCAQGAPMWGEPGATGPDLQPHASLACPYCAGSGIDADPLPPRGLNLANENAGALLGLLGLPETLGAVDMPTARRALMRARATFDRCAPAHVRERIEICGAPRESDGVVELRPLRFVSAGADLAYLRSALERFADLLQEAAAAGATQLTWS